MATVDAPSTSPGARFRLGLLSFGVVLVGPSRLVVPVGVALVVGACVAIVVAESVVVAR